MNDESAYRHDLHNYLAGLLAAGTLSALAFALVYWSPLPRATTLVLVAVLALLQVVAHLRYFLHINLGRQKREDLQLILFSSLILVLMAGGTLWLLANLADRMMPMPVHMP